MASLELVMPQYPKLSSQILLRDGPGSDVAESSPPLQFRSSNLLGNGNSQVFRGKFKEMVAGKKARKAICTFVSDSSVAINRLKFEAEVYENHLKDLQGTCIPTFYGFFTGKISGVPVACVLLQDCGMPLGDEPINLPIDLRLSLLHTLMRIHQRGIQHCDFEGHNMVVDNSDNPTRIMVVDFDQARLHECGRRLNIVLYHFPPDRVEFNCRELYDVTIQLDIWTDDTIFFNGGYVPIEFADSPETLVAHGPGFARSELLRCDPLAMAHVALAKYAEYLEPRREYIYGDTWKILVPVVEERESTPPEAD